MRLRKKKRVKPREKPVYPLLLALHVGKDVVRMEQ
jgi:hypothetical protein